MKEENYKADANGIEVANPSLSYSDGKKSNDNDHDHNNDSNSDPTEFDLVAIHEAHQVKNGFWQRRARAMARRPWEHLLAGFIISLVLSAIGLIVGNFSVTVEGAGWQSRGTLIADRQTQALMTLLNQDRLFTEGESAWQDLTTNVQPGWESDDDDDRTSRRLTEESRSQVLSDENTESRSKRELPFTLSAPLQRRLNQAALSDSLQGCNATWYSSPELTEDTHLWPIWETKDETISALDADVIRDICVAEANTNAILEANGLCKGCDDGSCMPAYSIVFFARLVVGDTNFSQTCDELSTNWESSVDISALQACVTDIKAAVDLDTLPDSCPFGFSPTLVDELFDADNGVVRYTSSIFATKYDVDGLYDHAGDYDRAEDSSVVSGVYDTQYEDFVGLFAEGAIGQDMALAMASAFITAIAILIHTRSCWLTSVGLIQIILSFPLAYFVYTFLGQLDFFPFLNFLGVFVVFALGADDIFVSVDKWKNARIADKNGSVEDVAAVALPEAAGAMFLTTSTTAVAFFATAIGPVAPLKCFAIFLGLLIVFDYFLCCLLVFPALCLYDNWRGGGCCLNCCVSCGRRNKNVDEETGEEQDEANKKASLIHRILLAFYKFLHVGRYVLLVLVVGGFVASSISAANLELPNSSDVRVLNGNVVQYERNYEWRQNLLYQVLEKNAGSDAVVIWGVEAADTGDQNNPESWSRLVLDDSFDPSSQEAQEFLVSFCDNFYAQEFADKTNDDYVCPINAFSSWLKEQSVADAPVTEYTTNCAGATGVPMSTDNFNQCIIGWSYLMKEQSVLSRNGVVEIMFVRFQSRVRYDSPYDDLDREWNAIEDYLENERKSAPQGVNGMYHSSDDFWWYDTNGSMLQAAFSAAGIALAAAAAVVLLSSRSLMLTLFAIFAIGYVLVSTTALLVAIGWTLGFLESVCFAILIGISCDFVIHFGHAYASLEGEVDRHVRTRYALLSMGPSILAAAFTTICSAVIMLFTIITFFQKFAIILFFTIIQATIGSFVVYLTLAETMGPSRPTYTIDWLVGKIRGAMGRSTDEHHDSNPQRSVDDGDDNSADRTEKVHDEA